jgi:hypothetical protein
VGKEQPSEILAKINTDISRVDKKAKKAIRVEEELIKKSKKLFEQSSQILNDCGETHQKSVGRGAGGNIIGFRLETESYLETPPVAIELFGDKKVNVVLSEAFTSSPGYYVVKDKVTLRARFDENPAAEQKQIFLIDREGRSTNWLGKSATIKQMNMIGEILVLMKDSLPKIDRKKESGIGINLPKSFRLKS